MKAFLLILSMGWCMQAFSQQDYFVFLQSESRQPFYVRMGEKNYSSSAAGHLILSKLKDSTYALTVGFPQNQFPEQDFTVRVSRKDRGFEIKNLGAQGWALFDLQSLELINASKQGAGSGGVSYDLIKRNDDFARLMAGVVNDTAVLYNVVMQEKKAEPVLADVKKEDEKKAEALVISEAKKADKNDEVQKQDTAALAKIEEDKKPETVAIVKTDEVKKQDTVAITKLDEPKKDTVAIAKTDEPKKHDTVAIAKTEEPKKDPVVVAKTGEPQKTDTTSIDKTEETKQPETVVVAPKKTDPDPIKDSVMNPPALPVIYVAREYPSDSGYHMIIVDENKDSIRIFIPADAPAPDNASLKKATDSPAKDSTTDKSSKLVMINSDCRSFATDMDVDKLRVKLIAEKDSEGRVAAAKKMFKSKCFSAQQIKALSEMFPYDEQKYKFFEAAYPFVSDTANFKELVSLLNDPAYVQRFRKLVRLD